MNHADHVRLLAPGIPLESGGAWADLGAGGGAFTLAIRDLAGPDVEITAVYRDRHALQRLQREMESSFPGTSLRLITTDFTSPLNLSALKGIMLANALHYVPVREQSAFLRSLLPVLATNGRLIVVEYDSDRGNQWVPYPVSARRFPSLLTEAGFTSPTVLRHVPSRFLGSIFAACAFAPGHHEHAT